MADNESQGPPLWGNTRIKGTFRKADHELNGLNRIAAEINAHPIDRYPVCGFVERHKYEEADGVRTLTTRFVQIEADLTEEERRIIRDICATAYTRRTGSSAQNTLFDPADDPADDAPAEAPKPKRSRKLAAVADPAPEQAPADDAERDEPWPGDATFSHTDEPVPAGV